MRRAAVLVAEAYGYQYLAVFDSDYYAEDYADHAAYWGLRSIATGAGWTLYHLE
jgi:hypothetical protein